PRDELFDLIPRQVQRRKQRRERGLVRHLVHAYARRAVNGLDDDRVAAFRCEGRRLLGALAAREAGHQHAGRRQHLLHPHLVAVYRHLGRRRAWDAQALANSGSDAKRELGQGDQLVDLTYRFGDRCDSRAQGLVVVHVVHLDQRRDVLAVGQDAGRAAAVDDVTDLIALVVEELLVPGQLIVPPHPVVVSGPAVHDNDVHYGTPARSARDGL